MTNKRILIIDDEEDIREIARLCFETVGGWQVSTAESGSEGLIYAESKQPDAILLDMMMPEMDGLNTLVRLRANQLTMKIPVIFITAKYNLLEPGKFAQLEVTGIIPKPFEPMTLAQKVENLLNLG
ncbi:response regulator [Mastigocoleus testarum]|uniref:Two-component system response regulator n=1 Tax=Mastigocoleus testarum BC008 TaxID=371196 RepID=A0A0V7ZMX9_9CYAN|nr:response regulator [Mastigocoleus testarum]KST65868.1 two-component system response regulator [Mastigocoleus testarum BC008]